METKTPQPPKTDFKRISPLTLVILLTIGIIALMSQCTYHIPERHVLVWANHKAEMLANVYGLTPESVDNAIDIFGERK